VRRSKGRIVEGEVPDQRTLRASPPAKDLDEFLVFLARLEAVFGRIERPRAPTTGKRFLL
jgi:hypothetical protein